MGVSGGFGTRGSAQWWLQSEERIETANKSTSVWEGTQRSRMVAGEGYGVAGGCRHKGRHGGTFMAGGNKPREREAL